MLFPRRKNKKEIIIKTKKRISIKQLLKTSKPTMMISGRAIRISKKVKLRFSYRFNFLHLFLSLIPFMKPLQLAKYEQFYRRIPRFYFARRRSFRYIRFRRIFKLLENPLFPEKTTTRRFEYQWFHALRIDERRLVYKHRVKFFLNMFFILCLSCVRGFHYRTKFFSFYTKGGFCKDSFKRFLLNNYIKKQLNDVKHYKNIKKTKKF